MVVKKLKEVGSCSGELRGGNIGVENRKRPSALRIDQGEDNIEDILSKRRKGEMEEKEEVEINGNVVMRKVYSKDKKEGNGVVWKKNGEPRKVTKEKQGGRIMETVSSGGGGDQQKEVLSMADVEKIGMMKGVLLSKGIKKVAVTGLQKKTLLGRCTFLEADVRKAELLFAKCYKDGVPTLTANFYLGRAYGLQVVNASYLAVWEKGEDMPDPADFPAYGFYQIEGKRRKIPLKPITKPLMSGGTFCLINLTEEYPETLIGELIIQLGGKVVLEVEDCRGENSFCIGETHLEGRDVYKPDWILDIVQQGTLVGFKHYLVEAPADLDDSGFVSQVWCIYETVQHL